MSEARCAAHPEVVAIGVCARCGDYCCRACSDPRHEGVCVRCGARLPSGLSWEDPRAGGLVRRFLRSVVELLVRPKVAFPGPARLGRALAFAIVTGLLIGTILLVMAGALAADPAGLFHAQLRAEPGPFALGLALACVLPAIALPAWAWVSALSFAAGLYVVGRRVGTLRIALRTCLYAQVVVLACTFVPFLGAFAALVLSMDEAFVDATRVVWIVSGACWPVLTGRIGYWSARGLGLTGGRAAFAAFGPSLLCAPISAYLTHYQLELLR